MQITTAQIGAFHALLKKHGLNADKHEIVKELSKGRATSTKDLYAEEVQLWINAMNKAGRTSVFTYMGNPGQKMINSVIAMAREMGMITRKQVVNAAGKMEWKSDYRKFNEWMLAGSCLKKKLNNYSYEELNKLVSQYKAIYTSWLKKYH
jgi:hypothetical protein